MEGDMQGRAVQVDPMKHTLKAPGSKHLKLECDKLLSSFAFSFDATARAHTWAFTHRRQLRRESTTSKLRALGAPSTSSRPPEPRALALTLALALARAPARTAILLRSEKPSARNSRVSIGPR
jgi:hypothetical protein